MLNVSMIRVLYILRTEETRETDANAHTKNGTVAITICAIHHIQTILG